jgi:hypothetical protein
MLKEQCKLYVKSLGEEQKETHFATVSIRILASFCISVGLIIYRDTKRLVPRSEEFLWIFTFYDLSHEVIVTGGVDVMRLVLHTKDDLCTFFPFLFSLSNMVVQYVISLVFN